MPEFTRGFFPCQCFVFNSLEFYCWFWSDSTWVLSVLNMLTYPSALDLPLNSLPTCLLHPLLSWWISWMQKEPSLTKHLSLEAEDVRGWLRALPFHHVYSALVLQQERTATFARKAQWEQFVTIFTNTALQPALIFSAAIWYSHAHVRTDIRWADLWDLNIGAAKKKKKKRITFITFQQIYFNVWKIKAASQNFSHGKQVYHSIKLSKN